MQDEFRAIYDTISTLRNEVSDIKNKLTVIDFFISNFKEQDSNTIKDVKENQDSIRQLQQKLYNDIKDIERAMEDKVSRIENKLGDLEKSMDPLIENSFLQFTKTMDMKKLFTLVITIVSILASAGILDNVVTDNISSDSELNDRIEKLIELAE